MSDEPRVALVTGGARGIGQGITLELARRGFKVIINYRQSRDAALALAERVGASGGQASVAEADVSDVKAVREMFQWLRREHHRLDVLVNNAGILHEGLFQLTEVERFWEVLHVNVGGVVNCCKSALPLLARHKQGRIINIASIAGIHGSAGLSAYASSKAAVIGLSKVLARELAPAGVRVNVVAPGLIDTDMPAGMVSPAARERALASQPVARIGRIDEVATVVGFLATEAPDYLTGEVLRVDGGALIG